MKHVQATAYDLTQFVANLYKDGNKPCERFGMSWESLTKLEEKVPELTCKQANKTCKTA